VAFVTLGEARAAASSRGITASGATAELRKAASAPMTTQYHFFLSHTREDAAVIAGVKTLIEAEGWKVYVYWAEGDATTRVNATTAADLRTRMNNCRALIYASSEASPNSKWMPWELGYFDGHHPGRVAIMPLPSSAATGFKGQEYLGLYPNLERFSWTDGTRSLGIRTGARSGKTLDVFIREGATV
jgi:hypothetical protein